MAIKKAKFKPPVYDFNGEATYPDTVHLETSAEMVKYEDTNIGAAFDAHKSDYAQQADVVLKNEITNGDFSNGLSGWDRVSNPGSGTIESLDTSDYISAPQSVKWVQNVNNRYLLWDVPATLNDKFYVSIYSKRNTSAGYVNAGIRDIYTLNNSKFIIVLINDNTWHRQSVIENSKEGGLAFFLGNGGGTTGTINFDNFLVVNLTKGFGKDNEPTQEEMDLLIEQIGYFNGEITLTQKQIMNWQLAMIRANTAAIAGL